MNTFFNRPVQSRIPSLNAGDGEAQVIPPSVEIRSRLKRALKNKWKQFFVLNFKKQSIVLGGLAILSFVLGIFLFGSLAWLAAVAALLLPFNWQPFGSWFLFFSSLCACALIVTPSVAANLLAPARLEFTDLGLRLHWQWWLAKLASPRISWDKMSYVGLVKHQGFIFEGSWLDFHLYARDVSLTDRLCFGLFYSDFWSTADHCRISIDLAGIEYGEQPQRLLTALSLHLPAERLEPRLLDALNPIKRDSYTTLWMDSLSSSSTRIRNEPLAAGMNIGKKRYAILGQIGAGGQGIAYLALAGAEAIPAIPAAEAVPSADALSAVEAVPSADALPGENMELKTILNKLKAISEEHKVVSNERNEVSEEHQVVSNGRNAVSEEHKMISIEHKAVSKDRRVVLKEFILPTHGGVQAQCRTLDSIQREADLLKQVTHPQIVHLLDFFVEDQRAYLVLEHIEGKSLRSLIEEEGCLTEARIRHLSLQLCDILEHLHSQSPPVIHRDFTPENIIVSADSVVKLIDFNVAQHLQSNVTKTVVGKHSYIPPEQFRGKATPQSDIYALGATMHYMATAEDPEPISTSHPKTAKPDVSEELDAIVAHATAKSLGERYQSIQLVRDDVAKL
jgi:serine/threonine protein kinase